VTRWGAGLATAAFVGALALSANGQPVVLHPHPPPPRPIPVTPGPAPSLSDDPKDLRGRFGVEKAASLVHSPDEDERLRGIERASALGTPEALALLVQQTEPAVLAKIDARGKIALARGLGAHGDQAPARAALLVLMEVPTPRASPQRAETDDPAYAPRLEMARRIAALALAESGDPRAMESLVALAANETNGASPRGGPGMAAALAALAAYPPGGSVTWAKPMTAGIAKLVARTGDLRPRGEVLDAAKGGDPATRAAAIEALGVLGDARVVEIAKGVLENEDARVRVAATSALVALEDPAGAKAVEALLGEDATAGQGILLAMKAHGAGIVKALAARVAVSADLGVRAAAIAALGRDPTADGVETLGALMADAMVRADAADAIARSPSAAAMGAIEHMAAAPATRRIAARAYVVRALVRGESSGALERTLAGLAASSDRRDRAAGVFARVALGETDAARWLDDRDPQVRRAAAMGSLRKLDGATRVALLSRRAREEDGPTRTVLAAGLIDGDGTGVVTTHDLRSCAHAGGADAPLCTLAIARRASEATATEADAFLHSLDPIVRAHAARGLARSDDPARGGRLVAAYAYEPDPLVRRAIFDALAGVSRDAPAIANAVALAARLDPDPGIRWMAARLPKGRPALSSVPTGSRSRSSSTPMATPWSPASPRVARGSCLRLGSTRRTPPHHNDCARSPSPSVRHGGDRHVRGRGEAARRDRPDARARRPPARGVAPALRGRGTPLARFAGTARCRAEEGGAAPRGG
jgi:HEAT repeat protein